MHFIDIRRTLVKNLTLSICPVCSSTAVAWLVQGLVTLATNKWQHFPTGGAVHATDSGHTIAATSVFT